ncbi:MAG: hypothetical protein ABIQ97_06590, partial [Lysobacteraceae bacterium]
VFCTAALFASLAALSACAPSPSTPTGSARAAGSPHDMVMQVRAAGSGTDALDVHPLRDPQVEDLRDRASKLEAAGDIAGASQAIAQALQLVPGDPDLLQSAAELALYAKDWNRAETDAMQSWQLGPKLGSLCRRNWTAIRYARLQRGSSAGAHEAEAKVAACTVEPPVRM